MPNKTVLVTGAAGFIGFHVAQRLLADGRSVVGLDSLNNYYDPKLKEARLEILRRNANFSFVKLDLADRTATQVAVRAASVSRWSIHLAAQAGVRYSLEHPHAYVDANLEGFINVLEGCRHNGCKHLVFASSSSVYGANTKLPFSVQDNVDHPISLYAASKKANELMAHAYSHLYRIPATGLRFFTVYGPWGRPDMAMFIFAKAILAGQPIKLFNHGKMRRDFTYVDDVSQAIVRLIDRPPQGRSGLERRQAGSGDQLRTLENLQYRQQPPRRADPCGIAAGEGIRPNRDQGDAADAARRRRGDLRRCRRSRARHRLSAGDDDRGRYRALCEMVS